MQIQKLLLALPLLSAVSFSAQADETGRHPAYIHALSDLRSANWLVQQRRPEDGAIKDDERVIREEISAAYDEIEHAAIRDGKDIGYRPSEDAGMLDQGRMHGALELLHKAHDDVTGEEDDAGSKGLKERALRHIDAAIRSAEHVVRMADSRR